MTEKRTDLEISKSQMTIKRKMENDVGVVPHRL